MSARSDILAAIGAARVPPIPPATERPASTVGVADLRVQFLRTLEAVRGTGVICPANHSLDDLLATILGPDRTAAMVAPGRGNRSSTLCHRWYLLGDSPPPSC